MIKFEGKGAVDAVDGLKRLGQFAPMAVGRALGKSLRMYRDAIQAAIPPSKTPGHSARNIQTAIGYRIYRQKGQILQAKVGINVGKKAPRQRVKAGESRAQFIARRSMIKPENMANPVAHLLILGTMDRWTGKRSWVTTKGKLRSKSTNKPRQYRGRMKRGYPFVARGVMRADPQVKAKFPKWLQAEIERELRKRGR